MRTIVPYLVSRHGGKPWVLEAPGFEIPDDSPVWHNTTKVQDVITAALLLFGNGGRSNDVVGIKTRFRGQPRVYGQNVAEYSKEDMLFVTVEVDDDDLEFINQATVLLREITGASDQELFHDHKPLCVGFVATWVPRDPSTLQLYYGIMCGAQAAKAARYVAASEYFLNVNTTLEGPGIELSKDIPSVFALPLSAPDVVIRKPKPKPKRKSKLSSSDDSSEEDSDSSESSVCPPRRPVPHKAAPAVGSKDERKQKDGPVAMDKDKDKDAEEDDEIVPCTPDEEMGIPLAQRVAKRKLDLGTPVAAAAGATLVSGTAADLVALASIDEQSREAAAQRAAKRAAVEACLAQTPGSTPHTPVRTPQPEPVAPGAPARPTKAPTA